MQKTYYWDKMTDLCCGTMGPSFSMSDVSIDQVLLMDSMLVKKEFELSPGDILSSFKLGGSTIDLLLFIDRQLGAEETDLDLFPALTVICLSLLNSRYKTGYESTYTMLAV